MKLTPYFIKNILLVVLENEQVLSMPSCMLKMTLKFENLKFTFFEKSLQKGNMFALNIQSSLSLNEIRQDKTKKTPVYT